MHRLCLTAFLLVLTACNGGGAATGPLPSGIITSSEELRSAPALSEAQSDALPHPQPAYTPGVNDLLYVGNAGNNSITVYRHDAHNNSAPLYVIAGSKTEIDNPSQLSEDSSGNLYVANQLYPDSSILVFAHGAKGNVAPIRRLAGPATLLHGIYGMTVDKLTGKLFAVTYIVGAQMFNPNTSLLRFAPNATGNVAPFSGETFADQEVSSFQIDSDSSGKDLVVGVGGTLGDDGYGLGIGTTLKQFPPGGHTDYYNFVPNVANVSVEGIADDPTTKTYLFTGQYQSCDHSNKVVNHFGIIRFAENASGYTDFPGYSPCRFKMNPPPISVIVGTNCGGQLAIGYLRNIYAICGNAVDVFTHDAAGNVPPLRVLSGPATKLNQPFGIYEGQ